MNKTVKEAMKRYGYREDFDWGTRFNLKTEINGYVVSTVDLGIDRSLGIGEPLYYETMIFKKDGEEIDWLDLYRKEYSTEKQARIGHQEAVKMVEEGKINTCQN